MKTKKTVTPAAATTESASTLHFGVRTVSADDAQLAERINYAIQHNGIAIYNGNDETETVPFISLLSLIFYRYDPAQIQEYEGEFGTFGEDAERVTFIDLALVAPSQRAAILSQHLDASTCGCWADNRSQFDDNATIAVRIDDADGDTWYEMIINNTIKQ